MIPSGSRGYVRPHELELSRDARGDGRWATVRHVGGTWGVVRLELEPEAGETLHAELAREAAEALAPRPGDRLFVRARRVRLFDGEAPAV